MTKKKVAGMPEIMQSKNFELFKIVKNNKGKYVVAMGEYLVTEKQFESAEDAERYIGTKPYELIFNVCSLIYKFSRENENKSKENA